MKLFFCDICNESIPLQDIKENKSTTIKGKIFCRGCNPLNELTSSESSSSAGAGGGIIALLGVAVLLLGGATGYLFYLQITTAKSDHSATTSAEIAALTVRVDDLRANLRTLQTGFDGFSNLSGLPAQITAMDAEAKSRGSDLNRVSADMKAVQEQLIGVGNLRDRIEGMSLRQDETSSRITTALAAIDSMKAQLRDLGDRPPVIVEREGPGADVGGSKPKAGPPDEELVAIIAKLSSADEMERWEGVDQIRRRNDPALIPHVVALLEDEDTFVRAQAIYTLGEWKAMPAVPKLVKLLRDDQAMIAQEALSSLITITGQNFRFDVGASKAAREKGIREWEDWVSKNSDKF